ncbi:MAG TPA: hypothetical protein P5263_07890 [Methanoregulaceae archaeon]|nr:hypothetical protein [Methanoregulaceae archaeon]
MIQPLQPPIDTMKPCPVAWITTRMMQNRSILKVVLSAILFLVPINVYMIGSGIGTGIQWALFRYQQTTYGNTLFTIDMDLGYVTGGVITGKSALSTAAWLGGVLLLVAALILVLLAIREDESSRTRHAGYLTIGAWVAFLAADMLQYGLIFSGPAGFVIPVGLPLVFIVGWWYIISTDREEGGDSVHEEEHSFATEE